MKNLIFEDWKHKPCDKHQTHHKSNTYVWGYHSSCNLLNSRHW